MQGIIRKTFVLMIAAIVMTAGFGLTLDPASAALGPKSMTLKVASGTGTSAVVDINGKVKVYVSSVYPSTYSKAVTWSIYSGSAYAKISNVGGSYCYVQGIKTATGLPYGSVTIKAKSKYYPYATKYIKLYVKQLYPTAVTLSKTSLHLWAGTGSTLTATVVKPSWVYNAGVTWSVNNKATATVGTAGQVTAVAAGATKVYATSKDRTSLHPYCMVNVYNARLTNAGPITMTLGDAPVANPAIVSGPTAPTTTYSSSNTAAVTVNGAGTITAVGGGSATITATVTAYGITAKKVLKYVVNVKTPLGNTFDFNHAWSYLEITQNTTGYLQGSTLMLNRSQIDDLFGYGSLGMNLWDPMDMYLNFQATDIAWHAGDFAFDKDMQSSASIADVEILPDKNVQVPTYHPYWLDDTTGDKNCVDLVTDSGGIVSGYEILFHYVSTLDGATNRISLAGNELTLQFEGSELKLVRNQLNQVQAFATADADGTLNDLILTITRTITGYHVVVNDPDYIAKWGIEFNAFKTYL